MRKRKIKYIPPPSICPCCGKPGPHFVPPSLGEDGFYICLERVDVKSSVNT